MPDEVARIGALSNGSNGQRSLESASLHFEALWRRERRNAEREPTAEILSDPEACRRESKDPCFEPICKRERGASRVGACTRNPERPLPKGEVEESSRFESLAS